MAITLDSVLNFIIPPLVFVFILFILYRIPLIKLGVDSLFEKFIEWREGKNEEPAWAEQVKTIEFE